MRSAPHTPAVPVRSGRRSPTAATLALALATLVSSPDRAARADEPTRAAEPTSYDAPRGRWQGTSWGFELETGLGLRLADDALTPAPLLGLGFRVSTLLTLVDAELFARTQGLTRTVPAGDFDLRRTSLGLELRLHPLFIRNLQGDFGSRALAGIHLAVQGAAEVLSVRGPEVDRTDVSFAFGFGLGVDLPLTDPDDGPYSLWLDLGWRFRVVGFPHAPRGLGDMDEQLFLLSLGLRFHDVSGLPLPKPPELDDRDR